MLAQHAYAGSQSLAYRGKADAGLDGHMELMMLSGQRIS